MKKSIDRGKMSLDGGKGSKQASTRDSLQPEYTVDDSMPVTTTRSVSKSATVGSGRTRHTAGPMQPGREQTMKALFKAHSHSESPDGTQTVASHLSRKGRNRAAVSLSVSPQQKSRKRRASEGDMQEHKLNAMIEDYKRKVFGSHK